MFAVDTTKRCIELFFAGVPKCDIVCPHIIWTSKVKGNFQQVLQARKGCLVIKA